MPVRFRHGRGRPAGVLVDESHGCALVVVGPRTGRFVGLLMGSVSQQVLSHADCPVAVVRPSVSEWTVASSHAARRARRGPNHCRTCSSTRIPAPGPCLLTATRSSCSCPSFDDKGRVTSDGIDRLVAFCAEALEIAEDKGAESMLAFATSARAKPPTATRSSSASGRRPARPAGARRRGRGSADLPGRSPLVRVSSGAPAVLGIGGGSLEIAAFTDEDLDAAVSLPLGAGRPPAPLSPPTRRPVRDPRTSTPRPGAGGVGGRCGQLVRRPDKAVATSKTFRSLARAAGAAPRRTRACMSGEYFERNVVADLVSTGLPGWALPSGPAAGRLDQTGTPAARRSDRRGRGHGTCSRSTCWDICPLREKRVILRRLDNLPDAEA